MNEHHEILPNGRSGDSSVFARQASDRVLLSFRSAGGNSFTAHLPSKEAEKLAFAILRGVDFVNEHKQVAEEV